MCSAKAFHLNGRSGFVSHLKSLGKVEERVSRIVQLQLTSLWNTKDHWFRAKYYVDALKTKWGGKMAIFIWIVFVGKTENALMINI